MHPVHLATEFPVATQDVWRSLVDAALKGVPSEKKLIVSTRDGLRLPALAMRDVQAQAIMPQRGTAPWCIAARIDHPNPKEANRLALEELEGGADMLILSLAGSRGARGFGVSDCTAATLDQVFSGIHLDLVSLRLEPGRDGAAQALMLAAWLKAQGYVPSALRVDFGLAADGADVAQTVMTLLNMGFTGSFLTCDGRMVHEAGGSTVQMLASVLAAAAQGLRSLTEAGLSLPAARAALGFTLVVDQDQVLSMASLRAMRLLIARMDEACGLAALATPLHVETAWRMQTKRDCTVTALRNVIAAFAAGASGADSLSVLPHTCALGLPDGSARRLARNTSHILIEETHLARVMDPAAGSGTIEGATQALAPPAWALFREIESQRLDTLQGLPAALQAGFLEQQIAVVRDARARDMAMRRVAITGTSEFPNLMEAPVPVLISRLGEGVYDSSLPVLRDSLPFEALRHRAEALVASGRAPSVFLANLGRVADFSARATFAKNLFEAGGIRAIGNDGFMNAGGTNLAALAAAYAISGASMVCLCGADAGYAQEAEAALAALRAAGAHTFYIAGRPAEHGSNFRAAGVTDFLFAGMDVILFLDAAIRSVEL